MEEVWVYHEDSGEGDKVSMDLNGGRRDLEWSWILPEILPYHLPGIAWTFSALGDSQEGRPKTPSKAIYFYYSDCLVTMGLKYSND